MKEDIVDICYGLVKESMRFRTIDIGDLSPMSIEPEIIREMDKQEYSNLYESALQKTEKIEYGFGSELYGGYYFPSPVIDFIVGGIQRGKTCLQKPNKDSYFKYRFDKNNRLICIEKHSENSFFSQEALQTLLNASGHFSQDTIFVFYENDSVSWLGFGLFRDRLKVLVSKYHNGNILFCASSAFRWSFEYFDFEYEKFYYSEDEKTIIAQDLIFCTLIDNNTKIKVYGDKNIFKREENRLTGFDIKPAYYSFDLDLGEDLTRILNSPR